MSAPGAHRRPPQGELAGWFGSPEQRRRATAVAGALLLAVLLAMPVGAARSSALLHTFVLLGVLGLGLRFRVAGLAALALIVAGVHLRLDMIGVGYSDVLDTTRHAIEVALAGGNPYDLGTALQSPESPPFPYGPLALLWYLPFTDLRAVELTISFLVLAALAVRGRLVGLALFALAPPLLLTASDGSNDHTAGLLLLGALLVARRNPLLGAAALAGAAAFKPYALAWLPPLVGWAGVSALAPFVLASAVLWGPAILLWGFGSIAGSISRAEQIHTTSYYSLAQALEGLTRQALPPALFNGLRLVLGGALAALSLLWVRSYHGMLLAGLFIYLATLFAGYWSTFAYFAAVAPLVCWHVDEWLGLAWARVRWPGDPAGRWCATLDRRWPARHQLRAARTTVGGGQ